MYYQPEIETIKQSDLHKLQVKRLKKSIDTALHSPFYAKVLGERGITSASISSVEDIRKLPFTTKADLREYYPFGLVATDMKNVVRRIRQAERPEILLLYAILSTISNNGPNESPAVCIW